MTMSVEIWVFLPAGNLPTREEWQTAIDTLGHQMVFEEFSINDHYGFVPVQLNGNDAGFEYRIEAISGFFEDSEDDDPELIAAVGHCDRVVRLKTHGGRNTDLEAMNVAAVAITRHADGVYFDPQSGEFARQGDVLEVAGLDL
jgi:hypothetical protein